MKGNIDSLEKFDVPKGRVSIEQVLLARGIELRRRGDRLVGPCPVHGGDNPNAFVVSLAKNLWYCFTGCASGGDIIKLIQCLDGVGYRKAAQTLMFTPQLTPRKDVAVAAALTHSPFRPYTRELRLDPFSPWLRRKGISASTARRFQAGAYHGYGMLAGCIAIRLHDPQGKPIGYAGRRLDWEQVPQKGKWRFPPRLPKGDLLYGYHMLTRRTNCGIAVTECPWGVLRLAQLDVPAVALLGTTITDRQRVLLQRESRVILILDGDDAGRMATQRLLCQLSPSINIAAVTLPAGYDPDDLDDTEIRQAVQPFFPS